MFNILVLIGSEVAQYVIIAAELEIACKRH